MADHNPTTWTAKRWTHRYYLKCWPEYFQLVWDGRKTFELRQNDRDFQPDSFVVLCEYDHNRDIYTGREVEAYIPHVFTGGAFDLPDHMCILSLVVMRRKLAHETANY